jgi:hypothetical protein
MGLENIQKIMIGVVMAIIIITSGVFMIGSFTASDSSIDSANQVGDFNATLDKSVEITTSVNNIQTSIDSVSEEKAGVLGWLNALIGSVFNGLKSIGDTLGFISIASTNAANLFGIPSFILPLLVLIIVIIIGFAIWAAIFKVN